jgi:hypothetical protein
MCSLKFFSLDFFSYCGDVGVEELVIDGATCHMRRRIHTVATLESKNLSSASAVGSFPGTKKIEILKSECPITFTVQNSLHPVLLRMISVGRVYVRERERERELAIRALEFFSTCSLV